MPGKARWCRSNRRPVVPWSALRPKVKINVARTPARTALKANLLHRGVGSGVIIDARGFVLTNNHVIERADEIELALADGRTFKGVVIGRDPKTDLAVVKVETEQDLPVVRLGDSDTVQVGHWAVAIGNPFGLGQSLTVGVISGVGRGELGLSTFEDYIQTDASINPGNSGGPLVNIRGEVIGINTAINPIGRGIGFAIPINMAKEVVQQLVENGRVVRGYLGVVIQTLSAELAGKFDLAEYGGVFVGDILRGSPAEQAGIKRGDVILDFAGKTGAQDARTAAPGGRNTARHFRAAQGATRSPGATGGAGNRRVERC